MYSPKSLNPARSQQRVPLICKWLNNVLIRIKKSHSPENALCFQNCFYSIIYYFAWYYFWMSSHPPPLPCPKLKTRTLILFEAAEKYMILKLSTLEVQNKFLFWAPHWKSNCYNIRHFLSQHTWNFREEYWLKATFTDNLMATNCMQCML